MSPMFMLTSTLCYSFQTCWENAVPRFITLRTPCSWILQWIPPFNLIRWSSESSRPRKSKKALFLAAQKRSHRIKRTMQDTVLHSVLSFKRHRFGQSGTEDFASEDRRGRPGVSLIRTKCPHHRCMLAGGYSQRQWPQDPTWSKRLQTMTWLQRAPQSAAGRVLELNCGNAKEDGAKEAM